MIYTLRPATDPKVDFQGRYNTLGKAFEKATDMLQYMDSGTEILIVNDLGNPVYSIKYQTVKQFTITELV